MTHNMNNFLGLPVKDAAYETAKVVVVPVPYEATVSYGGGTGKGPHAIITASSQVELYDDELDAEPFSVGIATMESVPVAGLLPQRMADRVRDTVARVLGDGKFPVILGGEHSITPPIVGAVAETHKAITVVQFDAHADLRQEYEGSTMNHACAMARVKEICPVVHLGIRNMSREEAVWVKKENLPVFYARDIHAEANWMDRALECIATDEVYLTIDVDAFDSSFMPATGTPEPGGLNWFQVKNFVRKLMQRKRVVGMDIVELAPIPHFHACDFAVAKLAYKCIGYWAHAAGLLK